MEQIIQELRDEIIELKRQVFNLKQNAKADYVKKWNYEKTRKKEMKEKTPEEYKKLQERRKETNKRYREKQKKILNNNK